jgi:adenylate cyclase
MAKDNDPKQLSPIALRMKEDLHLNGKGERTQESYLRMLRKFTEFLIRQTGCKRAFNGLRFRTIERPIRQADKKSGQEVAENEKQLEAKP